MRKLIRVVLVVVVVFVAAVVAVRLLVPADALMRKGFDQLYARTGIHASAASATVSFPWPVGIKLRQLQVSGPERAGQTAGPRVQGTVQEVVVTAELMSLLRRKPSLQEIRLQHPDLEVWVPEPTPGAPVGEATPGAAGGAGLRSVPSDLAAAIGLFSISDGRVAVHAPHAQEIRLDGVQQRARLHLQEGGALTGSVESTVGTLEVAGAALPGPLRLTGVKVSLRVEGNLQARRATLTIADLTAAGARLKGPIELDLAAKPAVKAELELDVDLPAAVAALGPLAAIPQAAGQPVEIRGGRIQGQLRVEGALPEEQENPQQWIALVSGTGSAKDLRISALGRADLVQGSARWTLRDGKVQLDDLAAAAPGVRANGSVTAQALPGGDLRGKITLDLDCAPALALAKEIWPKLPAELRAGKQDPAQWPGVTGTVSVLLDLKLPRGKPLDPQLTPVAWEATLGRLALWSAALPDTLHVLGGNARGTMLRADLFNIEIEGPGTRGTINAGLSGWPERIDVTGQLAFRQLDLDAWMPKESGQPGAAARKDVRKAWLQGVLPPQARAQGAATAPVTLPVPPENLVAKLVIRADELRSRGYQLTDLLARGQLEKRVLRFGDLQANLGTGKLVGGGTVDLTKPTPTWSVDAQATAVPAKEVFAPFAASLAQALSANLSGRIQLSGPVVADAVAIQSHLTGTCDVKSDKGQLRTQPLLGDQLTSLLGAAEAKRFEALDFSSIATILKLQDGQVRFDDLLLDGPTSVAARGSIGIVDQRVDYSLTVKLPPGVTPDLGAFTSLASLLRDDKGRITVALRVSGPARKPKIELDLAEVQKRAKEGGQQALKDKLRQFFPGAASGSAPPAGPGTSAGSGTPPPAGQSPAAASDSLKEKASKAVKDLLDGLKKKNGND